MKLFYCYLIIINIITFISYGVDKLKAKMKSRRIKEATLLSMSIFGGAFLGFFAMILFNHKVKVNRFIIVNLVSIAIYIFIIYYFGEYVWN